MDTHEPARLWVNRYRDAGFQQMKMYSSVKLEQIKAVADEAHRLGMTVTGHIPEGVTVYQALEAGQDQINHIQHVVRMVLPSLPTTARRPEILTAASTLEWNSPGVLKALEFLKAHRRAFIR